VTGPCSVLSLRASLLIPWCRFLDLNLLHARFSGQKGQITQSPTGRRLAGKSWIPVSLTLMLRSEAQSTAATRSADADGTAHPKNVGERKTRETRASRILSQSMLADFIAGIGHAYRRYASVGCKRLKSLLERRGAVTKVNLPSRKARRRPVRMPIRLVRCWRNTGNSIVLVLPRLSIAW
jgi:hypothetical protein